MLGFLETHQHWVHPTHGVVCWSLQKDIPRAVPGYDHGSQDVSILQVICLCCANVPSASLACFYSVSLTKSWIEIRGCAEFSLHIWIPIGTWIMDGCTVYWDFELFYCLEITWRTDWNLSLSATFPQKNALVVILQEKFREKVAITFPTRPGRVSERGCLASTFVSVALDLDSKRFTRTDFGDPEIWSNVMKCHKDDVYIYILYTYTYTYIKQGWS